MKIKHKNTEDVVTPTFTKQWVSRILWMSFILMEQSYLLAFMGKTEIAEGLSKSVCTICLGTLIPYLCKSFFETFCEKRNELAMKGLINKNDVTENVVINDDESDVSVG